MVCGELKNGGWKVSSTGKEGCGRENLICGGRGDEDDVMEV